MIQRPIMAAVGGRSTTNSKQTAPANKPVLDVPSDAVLLSITNLTLSNTTHKKYMPIPKAATVHQLKMRMWYATGIPLSNMALLLKDRKGNHLAALTEDNKPLSHYSPVDGCQLFVMDERPKVVFDKKWLEEGKVEKYVMSDEKYNQRENTFRKFKEKLAKQKPDVAERVEGTVGHVDQGVTRPSDTPSPAPATTISEDHEEEQAAELTVGQRCTVEPGARPGTVRYIGKVQGAGAGYWAGVALDGAQGRNDGSTSAGLRYFDCAPGHGTFVRPSKVTPVPALGAGSGDVAAQGAGGTQQGGLRPEDEI